MALDQTAIYLETDASDGVADTLGLVFAQQREGRPGAASLRLAAAPGWVVVLGAEALDGRSIIAEGLSRELGGVAAALALTGAAFRWSCAAFRAGAALPVAGFAAPPLSGQEAMPRYPDAELDAYQALLKLGVPPSVALLTPGAIGAAVETHSMLELRVEGGQLQRTSAELSVPTHAEGDPPVSAGIQPARGQWLEPRAVSGEPNAEALRRLQALEAAYRQRALTAAPPPPRGEGARGGGATRTIQFVYRWADGRTLDLPHELSQLEAPSLLTRILRGRR